MSFKKLEELHPWIQLKNYSLTTCIRIEQNSQQSRFKNARIFPESWSYEIQKNSEGSCKFASILAEELASLNICSIEAEKKTNSAHILLSVLQSGHLTTIPDVKKQTRLSESTCTNNHPLNSSEHCWSPCNSEKLSTDSTLIYAICVTYRLCIQTYYWVNF